MRIRLGDFKIVVEGKEVPFCGLFPSQDGAPIFIGEHGELNGLTDDQRKAVNAVAQVVNRAGWEATLPFRAHQEKLPLSPLAPIPETG
ncbi:MAG: hypothetical protein UV58_C0005G0028 [Candidatus Wolfebacteria bacterium GW2011_GWC1_43_10]|uniref:Uncharacterized protein n=2 Tax=Candidatus Wolfeibacteriota TaxID=1752735 RepID=A0A0G1CBJ8_9BACT|nr:MAG: hypothetical protein UV58_C0005G0028 [Candidatus Wolfebacteria bacterium GW2011_GWC1_43_10]KKT23161.1 MAG: hypothetical protein UW08_C0001G0124 [Parcubacteria group bacterium GW2011_GWB1_43_8b]OGM89276.1 MAG: hypothetical protein A2108_00165 [Candidatus Wolfebacteria bacterium GWA1_42_9]